MSTDDPYSAPATLAAAPATAHCAYDFAQVDVFAENPLEGNALAIFTDARGLSTAEMQALARDPTLGTASWLYWNHPVLRGAEQITLDLDIGPIPVRFIPPQPCEQGVFNTMQQKDPTFGEIRNSREDHDAL